MKKSLLPGVDNKVVMKMSTAAGKLEDYSYLNQMLKSMGVNTSIGGANLTMSNRVRYTILCLLSHLPMYTNSGDIVYTIERSESDELVFLATDSENNKSLIMDFRHNKKGDLYYVVEKYMMPNVIEGII